MSKVERVAKLEAEVCRLQVQIQWHENEIADCSSEQIFYGWADHLQTDLDGLIVDLFKVQGKLENLLF